MTHIKKAVLIIGALAIMWWAWSVIFPNPERVIRKQMINLAETGSFAAGGGNISRVLSVDKLGGFFAPQVELALSVRGLDARDIRTREELKQAILAIRGSLTSLQVDFLDIHVEMLGKESAIVNLTLNATVNGEKNAVVGEFKFNLNKIEGDWLITRVQDVKTLR